MNTLKTISVSLIDYIGKIENGIGVILSLLINDVNYEIIYWFDKDNNRSIKIEDKFYKHFPEIRDIYEYEYLIDLYYHIDTNILPNRNDIYKEFF